MPILAKSGGVETAGTGYTARRSEIDSTTEQAPRLDMAAAQALAKRIRTKLEGRPRLQDSTEIIRAFRDA